MKNELRATARKIDCFIRKGELEMGIKADQKKCRILGESDLQACVNHRLQKYLKKEKATENWYILNEHHLKKVRYRKSKSQKKKKNMKKKNYRPDIVIACKRKDGTVHPKFIIELKEFKNPTTSSKIKKGIKHDLDKMVGYFKKSKRESSRRNQLRKGYSIWCVSEPHRSFDPKEIQRLMRDYIQNRIKKRRMKIEPIVINAFYNNRKPSYKIKRGTDNSSQRLKNKQKVGLNPQINLIHQLKKLQL